ncbi:alpha-tocopherol transfer protein-like [Anoplophora glabripennis]|uniref:alpha-tocopherol transfer protein-like n=1 Tax=Anoplophora glabripennis TaxID=217634 RepID=UPI0008738312|nr:alpha-tocopherol transfer protein-like [Anoplophora glabripennis]
MESSVDSFVIPPTNDQLRIIRDEINEDEDRSPHVENLLYTWINCQPHFPKKYDKRIIRTFLRSSKYDMERTKAKLECNFTVRNLYPDIFSGRSTNAADVVQALDTVIIVFLPKFTENGNKVSIYKLKDTDPSRYDVYAVTKLFFMMYDLTLTSQYPNAGEIAIFDGSGLSPNHFVTFLTIIKIVTPILRRAYGTRLKEIHILNAPPLLEKILSVIKPILHHKVKNAFNVHSSSRTLCDYFGKEILPSNYGGKCKSLEELMKVHWKILNNNEEWFLEQENMKITKTIPKKIDNNLYFKESDIQGSFRTLQID